MAEMVRVDETTHTRLKVLAEQTGQPMSSVLTRAVEELETRLFWDACSDAYERLHADPTAWADYQAEREGWDSIHDGLRDEPPYPGTEDAPAEAR